MVSQLRRFEAHLAPYDLPYVENMDTPELWWGSIKSNSYHLAELALRLFGIIPSQSSCKQNFSTLKWLIGDRRTRLAIQKLENMTKIRSYYLTNIRSELLYYGKELTNDELKEVANYSSVGTVMTLESDEEELANDLNIDLITPSKDTLILEDIIDLTFDINDNELHSKEKDQNIILPSDLEYNPEDVIDSFL